MQQINLNFFEDRKNQYTESLKKLLIKRKANQINDEQLRSLFINEVRERTDLDLSDFKLELERVFDLNVFQKNNTSQNSQNPDDIMSVINDVVDTVMQDEQIIQNYDANTDGVLDDDEKTNFFNSIASSDGNGENITLDDILSSFQINKMKNEELYPTQESQQTSSTLPAQAQGANFNDTGASVNSTSSNSPTHKNTHATNYQEPGGDLATNAKAKDVKERIEQINKEIEQKNNEKAEINEAFDEYKNMISNLNSLNATASQSEAKIADLNTQLHNVDFDLTAAQTEINNIPDAVIMEEMQSEIDNYKAELQAKIDELTAQKTQIETSISQEQENLNNINEQIAQQQEQISDFEEAHPSDEIDEINNEIDELEEEKTSLENELNQQRQQELNDAQVYGKASAYRQSELVKFMMDYATNPNTKAYYDDMYYNNFKGGAYCAVFSSDVIELMYQKAMQDMNLTKEQIKSLMSGSADKNDRNQGVTGNQFACSVTGTGIWGDKIQPALNQAGINVQATIDITRMSDEEKRNAVRDGKIYPGMAFTYQENGRLHVGFIESINRDLSWNTIEGNTAVTYTDGTRESNTVGAHKRDATNPVLSTVTDATTKVLYWMKMLGYSDSQINSLIYNA